MQPIPADLAAIPSTVASGVVIDYRDGYQLENNDYGSSGYRHLLAVHSQAGKSPIGWRWAYPDPSGSVMAYPEVRKGKKPWTDTGNDPDYPRKVKDSYSVAADLVYRCDGEGSYNVAFDMWITSTKRAIFEEIVAEVMVWLQADGSKATPAGEHKPTYTDPLFVSKPTTERPWTLLTFMASSTDAIVELGTYLQTLTTMELIDPEHYLASVEFGTEIWDGSGWLALDRLDITL